MRFSLATLLIVVIWLAMGMLVWFWREPWSRVPGTEIKPANSFGGQWDISPDGLRIAEWAGGIGSPGEEFVVRATELDRRNLNRVFQIVTASDVDGEILRFGFLDDETIGIAVRDKSDSHKFIKYRRRFSEEWWGHLYRPEVWIFFCLTGVVAARATMEIRNRRRNEKARVLQ